MGFSGEVSGETFLRPATPHHLSPPPPSRPPVGAYEWHGDVDKIEQLYEDLRDSREELMGHRFHLQAIRKDVRTVREQTGAKEGLAISQLRIFLNNQAIELPKNIEENFEEVFTSRDQLGSLEADYDEAEEKYNLQEIKYTQKEAEFTNKLLDGDTAPTPMLRPDASTAEADGLMSFALGSPEGWNARDTAPERTTPVETTNTMWSQDENRKRETQDFPTVSRATSRQSDHGEQRVSRSRIDKICSQSSLRRADVRVRIEEWLQNMIEMSTLQKMRAYYPSTGMDTRTWCDVTAGTESHDKSTFSSAIDSDCLSRADSEVSDSENVDLKTPQPRTLLPEEQTLDELDDPKNPQSISSGDLGEPIKGDCTPTIRLRHNADNHTPSVSTEAANTHRTFSSRGLASNITTEEACSCLNYGSPQVRHGRLECPVFCKTHVTQSNAQRERRSPLGTPRQTTVDAEALGKLSSPVELMGSLKPLVLVSGPHLRGHQNGVVNDHMLENFHTVSNVGRHTLSPRPDQIPLPASPDLETRSSQSPVLILRLTSAGVGPDSISTGQRDLQWVPFVTDTNPFTGLPNPASDATY